jgi:hypothetical protein
MSADYYLHTDNPTETDSLGRSELVADMVRRVVSCECPQVLGLHGDWGSGKTSALMQVRKQLEKTFEKSAPLVWFEAWRYQNESTPIVALLHAIRERLSWRSKAWSETKKLGEITIRSALLHWDEITRIIGVQAPKIDSGKIEKAGETWEKEHLAAKLPAQATTELLNQALDQLLGKEAPKGSKLASSTADKNRLVIIIDDLDRCHPEAAFRLLEGIKIYLGLRRCVFILGINQREIERAIEKQIPAADDADSRRARAKEYLDKLCGHIWRLPYLDTARQASLIKQWLVAAGLAKPFVSSIVACVQGTGCLPPNPRKMKRFANGLISLVHRAKKELAESTLTEDWKTGCLVLLACLDAFHPELHRRLQIHDACWLSIGNWCRNGEKLAKGDPLAPALEELQLITVGQSAQHYDPAAPNVFYPQRLINELESVTIGQLKPFLCL